MCDETGRPGPRRPVPLVEALSSLPFSVLLLLVFLAAAVTGTLIVQGAPAEEYLRRYGAAAGSLLLALGLDDLFRTPWFAGLAALLVVSLLLAVVRNRAWRPPLWGHLLAHLGVVAVLAGGWMGRQGGFKGALSLHKGETAEMARRLGRRGAPGQPVPLGFSVRLEDLEVDYYGGTGPRFRVYERAGTEGVRTVASFGPEEAGGWRPLGSAGTAFRLAGDSALAEVSPDVHVVAVRGEGGNPPEEAVVRVGEVSRLPGAGLEIEALEYLSDFVYDTEAQKASSRSPEPRNPALRVRIRDLGTGGEEERWLFARVPGFGHGESGGPGYFYRHRGGRGNPAAAIVLREGGREWESRLEAGYPLRLPDGKTFLALEADPPEPRAFRGRLSILEDGRAVAGKTISVNDPLSYRGTRVYLDHVRTEDPTYLGLQVVRDPGLPVVFVGFGMISLGVVFIYYVRPVLLGRTGDAV